MNSAQTITLTDLLLGELGALEAELTHETPPRKAASANAIKFSQQAAGVICARIACNRKAKVAGPLFQLKRMARALLAEAGHVHPACLFNDQGMTNEQWQLLSEGVRQLAAASLIIDLQIEDTFSIS